MEVGGANEARSVVGVGARTDFLAISTPVERATLEEATLDDDTEGEKATAPATHAN